MKRHLALTGLILTLCAIASAQDGGRVVVPARSSNRPRLVKASLVNAGVTVRTHAGREVIIETASGSRHREERSRDGLRRIDIPGDGFNVAEDDNVITVRTGPSTGNLVFTVPVDTSVELKSVHGPIVVDGLHGEVVVSSVNGRIDANNISGTIVAETTNGAIRASMDRVDPSKPISFSSTNGSVEVTLPADLRANLKMRSYNGSIWTDFEMVVSGGRSMTSGSGGRYEVKVDRTMYGTINGGGVEATFTTLNGKIVIKKK